MATLSSNQAATPASGREREVSAIILAAGKGTRMKSDLPKVCHPIGGRAMVCAVVDACLEAGVNHIVPVVGYQKEKVVEALGPYLTTSVGRAVERMPRAGRRLPLQVEFAVQEQQLGTGHAVLQARPHFEAVLDGQAAARDVFVLCGDGPLIRAATLRTMLERHRSTGAAATLATSVIDDPTGYGRIVRDGAGRFERIVEHKNASEAQRAIREVNPSYYVFDAGALFAALAGVTPNAASGEYYITDVFENLLKGGQRVEVIDAVPPEDVLSINTPEQLAEVDRIYRGRSRAARPDRAGHTGASSAASTKPTGGRP